MPQQIVLCMLHPADDVYVVRIVEMALQWIQN